LPLGTAGTEKRSGVVSAGRRVGIPQLCRRWLTAATAGKGHHIVLAADPLFAAPPRPRTRTKTRMPRRG
jgi:hypothetical protein